MTGAMNEYLVQQTGVSSRANDTRICLLVLVGHESVAGRVHGKYWKIQAAVEGDVIVQICHSSWIRCDARSYCQGAQILV